MSQEKIEETTREEEGLNANDSGDSESIEKKEAAGEEISILVGNFKAVRSRTYSALNEIEKRRLAIEVSVKVSLPFLFDTITMNN